MAEKLTAENFDDFIAKSELPVFVDFYNDGCIPCRRIAPIISKAEAQYGEKIQFTKVNTAANAALAEKYEIQAAPTLILFKNGAEVTRRTGAADNETIINFIKTVL